MASYLQCLETKAMDAAESFISKVSDSKMWSCTSDHDLTCTSVVTDVATKLPAGTKLSAICPGRIPLAKAWLNHGYPGWLASQTCRLAERGGGWTLVKVTNPL